MKVMEGNPGCMTLNKWSGDEMVSRCGGGFQEEDDVELQEQ